jgi:hypothetical protein
MRPAAASAFRVRGPSAPGLLQVRGGTIRDVRNHGVIDLATLLARSSNVGGYT